MTESPMTPFREIAEYTYDWETWVTPDGQTRWVNAAVERMTGYSVAECLAMPDYPLPLVLEEDHPRILAAHETAAAGGSGNDLEFRIRQKDGHQRWGAMSWQSIFDADGTRLGFRTSVRDIDERKAFEARLREAKRRAEAADRSKTSFLAGVSHELRTPLQSILGQAELLAADPADDTMRRRVDTVVQQATLLSALVDDLLDLAGAELGRMRVELRPTALVGLTQAVVEAVRPLVSPAIELELDVPEGVPLVQTDGRRLTQILRNLLDNAIRATHDGRITLRVVPGAGDVRIRVEDTGVGFGVELLQRLEQPFEQGDDAATRGRIGLGLAIVHRLADALGIRTEVDSAPGRGTRFDLFVPVSSTEAGPPSAGLRVLLVDDTPASREVLHDALLRHGCRVHTAGDGEAAVRACLEERPDLVLMDLHMPLMDGITAAHRMRSQLESQLGSQLGEQARPRVVILTADPTPRSTITAGDVDAFVDKPLSQHSLSALLRWVRTDDGDELRRRASVHDAAGGLDPEVVADLRAATNADGESMFDRVARRVVADNRPLLEGVELALVRGRLEDAARDAHRIAGNCLLIGDRAGSVIAQRLLDTLGEGSSEADSHLRELQRHCGRLEQILRGATQSSSGDPG